MDRVEISGKGGRLRVWDVNPKCLCRQHLLGEHRELHGLWNILVLGKKGYSQHPETKRWVGKLKALYLRHEKLVAEMQRRGYNHKTDLDKKLARGSAVQRKYINPLKQQHILLKNKDCACPIAQSIK